MTKNTLTITVNANETCIFQLLSCREPTYVIHAANSNTPKNIKEYQMKFQHIILFSFLYQIHIEYKEVNHI